MRTRIIEDFHSGKRSSDLPLVENDTARVLKGDYAGRVGTVVLIDTSKDVLQFLIDFGDGTDELVSQDNLEKV
jgi:hypothetical protein